MPTLILAFEGPMQAWGSGSKFDTRETGNIPTKSGVIGMIGAAMGRKRGESLDDLNELKLTVRVDQPGHKIVDLQTMQVRGVKDLYLGRKAYLVDAKFLVCLTHSDQAFLEKIQDALNHPFYPISLGRRNCVPTGNLVREIQEKSGVEAAQSYPWLGRKESLFLPRNTRKLTLPVFTEGENGFRQFRMKDRPVSFDQNHRQYKTRMFSEISPAEYDLRPDCEQKEIDFFKEAANVSE